MGIAYQAGKFEADIDSFSVGVIMKDSCVIVNILDN